ncbi:DCN1-like protein 2 [Chlorella vulgaris]
MAPKRKRAATVASPKKASKDLTKLDTLFNAYKDKGSEEDVIGPDGVEKLCRDLKVDPSQREVLLLAWKMGAKRMGYFSRQEFRDGLSDLGAITIAQLRKVLPRLPLEVQDSAALDEFHRFAFSFCLTEPGQKIIDSEMAAQMLPLVLPEGRFVPQFCTFLTEQKDYKKVNADQWANFLRFSREVKADLSNCEDNPAWPLLLDNFVEYLRQHDEAAT